MASDGAPVLIDTNVLVYASDVAAPQHQASRALRDAAASGELAAAVTTQILFEYVAVVTNHRRVARPVSVSVAWEEVARLTTVLTVVSLPAEDIAKVADLSQRLGLAGPDIFDLGIAVAALSSGIDVIYTYDASVFRRVPGLTVRVP